MAEADDPANLLDLDQQRLVFEVWSDLWPAGEKDALGSIVAGARDEVPPEVVGQERHERSDRAERLHHRIPQGFEGSLLPVPEARTTTPDVPVGEVTHEGRE